MEILYGGTVGKEELIQVMKLHYRLTWSNALSTIVLPLMIAAVFIVSMIATRQLIPPLLIFPAIAILAVVFRLAQPYLSARNMAKNGSGAASRLSGKVSGQGITLQTPNATSELQWTLYSRSRSSADLVLLYQQNNWFNYFPRRFFQSDGDWERFLHLVAQKIPLQGQETGEKETLRILGRTISVHRRWPMLVTLAVILLGLVCLATFLSYNLTRQPSPNGLGGDDFFALLLESLA